MKSGKVPKINKLIDKLSSIDSRVYYLTEAELKVIDNLVNTSSKYGKIVPREPIRLIIDGFIDMKALWN